VVRIEPAAAPNSVAGRGIRVINDHFDHLKKGGAIDVPRKQPHGRHFSWLHLACVVVAS
jgi:hypothetical protein